MAGKAIDRVMKEQKGDTDWKLSYTREAIQNYVMSDEPELFSKELTYQSALLKRYSKLSDKVLMFTPGHFV